MKLREYYSQTPRFILFRGILSLAALSLLLIPVHFFFQGEEFWVIAIAAGSGPVFTTILNLLQFGLRSHDNKDSARGGSPRA